MKNKYAKFLRDLSGNAPLSQGVCGVFGDRFDVELRSLLPSSVYQSWEHFSGDVCYPVPSTDPDHTAGSMYYSCLAKCEMWSGEYGKLRMSWCAHLANYFEDLANGK